jgi:lysophospholipase L1-like esterase
VETYKENLKTIIQHPATRAQNPRIILISPPPINEYQLESFDAAKETPHPSRTASGTRQYADAAREVGASLNVPVADLWTAFMKTAGWEEGQSLVGSRDAPNSETLSSLLTDGAWRYIPGDFLLVLTWIGLHLTPAGYRIVHGEVMKVIEANWPDQMPDNLPMVFPSWVDAPK